MEVFGVTIHCKTPWSSPPGLLASAAVVEASGSAGSTGSDAL
jgi:hypothetical protein